jgi:hypothetical protein
MAQSTDHYIGFVNDQKVATGREGDNVPSDFYIPPAGLEDVDRAVYDLFDSQIAFQVSQRGKQGKLTQPTRGATEALVKVPVIFATGERFAHVKRLIPFRDSNNTIVLPIISVGRKGLNVGTPQIMPGITHRGVSDFILTRRLAKEDADYQRVLNKLKYKNASDIASRTNFALQDVAPGNQSLPGTIASRRNGDNLSYTDLEDNEPLLTRLGDNIFEIITMPYPIFFSASYEVTFWTQFTQHMNSLIEIFLSARSGIGQEYKIKSKKGYFYIAELSPDASLNNNVDNFSDEERIIKTSFTLNVMGYVVAPQQPGQTSPFRRFLSAPTIDFQTVQTSGEVEVPIDNNVPSGDASKFLLSDLKEVDPRGRDVVGRGEETATVPDTIHDPFTGSRVKVVKRVARKGETVASSRLVVDLEKLGR